LIEMGAVTPKLPEYTCADIEHLKKHTHTFFNLYKYVS